MDTNLEKLIGKLKNLYQYQDKTEEELIEIAQKKLQEKELEVENQFVDKEEKKKAKELFRKYQEDYPYLETVSDINLLNQLVFLEILNMRMQDVINTYVNTKNKATVPTHMVDSFHKNLTKIAELKDQLGLMRREEQTDAYKALETLKKRFTKHVNKYRADFTMGCPHCGKMTLLCRRTKDMGNPIKDENGKIIGYKAEKHPFFKGRILYNKPLLDLVRVNKITIEEAAKVLETSPDYIKLLLAEEI